MNLKNISLAILLVIAFVGFGRADEYETWYQFSSSLTQADGLDAICWEDPANPGDLLPAENGKDYYIPSGKKLRASTTATFKGRTLAVAGTVQSISPGAQHTYNELRLLQGGQITYGTFSTLAGKVVVVGTASIAPFLYGSNQFGYSACFESDGDAVLNLAVTKADTREAAFNSPEVITGDWSGFNGELRIGAGTCVRLNGSAMDFAGKVTALAGSYIDVYNRPTTVQFGALDLQAGAELYVRDDWEQFAVITVTNSLTIHPGAKIGFSTMFKTTKDGKNLRTLVERGIALFKLTGAAAENAPSESDMAGVVIENFVDFPMPEGLRLCVRDNGDGTKDVVLGGTPAITMILNNQSNGAANPRAFSEGNGDCWSTGVVPAEDSDDFAVIVVSSLGLAAYGNIVRPNFHLTVPGDVTIYHQAESFTVGELTMVAGSSFCTYGAAGAPILRGKMIVYPQTGKYVSFGGWTGRNYRIYSEISGAGDIKVGYNQTTAISAELFGTNSNFSGRMYVTSDASQWDPAAEPALDICATLYLNDGRNLGGAYGGTDGWKALTVENHSKVTAKDDVIVTEPTRGVYVATAARFSVPEEKTMSFAGPITYGGELTKLGAGCLALGKAQFSDAGAAPTDTPTANANVLTVTEGSVSANDKDTFGGVATSFAAGTALCVDLDADDADLLAYGASFTKEGTTLAYADAALKVMFRGSAPVEGEKTVAICTVPAEMSKTFRLDVQRKVGRCVAVVTTRTNDDGSVTYLATLSKHGLMLILR